MASPNLGSVGYTAEWPADPGQGGLTVSVEKEALPRFVTEGRDGFSGYVGGTNEFTFSHKVMLMSRRGEWLVSSGGYACDGTYKSRDEAIAAMKEAWPPDRKIKYEVGARVPVKE